MVSILRMKEHKLPKDSFILGRYIPNKICDNLIDIFNKNKRYASIGKCGFTVRPKDKKSLDLGLHSSDSSLVEYNECLNKIIREYELMYQFKEIGVQAFNNVKENTNIQYYKPTEGFYTYHTERTSIDSTTRCLVFMTYLNNVDNGGTEFLFQKLKIPAKKGLTLIWPSDFTHTHRGVVSKTQEKYILTGWMNYV
jgi:prolyl 4-hydroxylase